MEKHPLAAEILFLGLKINPKNCGNLSRAARKKELKREW